MVTDFITSLYLIKGESKHAIIIHICRRNQIQLIIDQKAV